MATTSGGNGQRSFLSGDTFQKIGEQLTQLQNKTNAKLIIFADSEGHAITQKGATTGVNVNALAALAAGHYAATNEISKMLGEDDQFKFIFHEGVSSNMYSCLVNQNFILVVVFDVSIALGMIRIYTARTIKSLAELLENQTEHVDEKIADFLDIEFSTLLNQELDKAFDKFDM
jgi:predicted regulator of Ras-like GTPase activity (Roadblock/LC7/MglB family)